MISNQKELLLDSIRVADLVVVGSGLYGLTIARELAESGLRSVILEKRRHIGGNTYSEFDGETGIEIHLYGSHLFHTSNVRIWNWISQFSDFTDYRHQVFTIHDGRIFEMPPTLREISHFFPGAISAEIAKEQIRLDAGLDEGCEDNFETKGISLLGRKMYNALIAGYTEKQWQTKPSDLPSDYLTRLPFRTTYESGYFKDKFQGLPSCGYGELVSRIADHSRIKVFTQVDFFDVRAFIPSEKTIVYTGPLDEFFEFSEGRLAWRTLDFDFSTLDMGDFQSTAVMNYADLETPWTRIHEFRHLHPERNYSSRKTVIAKEYSRWASEKDEPYYPVNSPSDKERVVRYKNLAKATPNVYFGGRLASYRYLDMHMAIGAALKDFEQIYSQIKRVDRLQ